MRIIKNHRGWQRVLSLFFPYVIIVGGFQLIGALISGVDISNIESTKTSIQELTLLLFNFIGTFIVLWLFMKHVDEEKFINLGFKIKNRKWDIIIGIVIGLITMSIGFVILISLGEITFRKINYDSYDLIILILLFILVAFAEEVLLRGYILRNLMISFNKYLALILSSIIFSIMHIFNPNIDVFALFELFIAGIFLGLSYIYTKNLWFPISLHFSWNFFQSFLGFNVSGKDFYSLIELGITKNNILNGGAFGFEGSILSLAASIIMILLIKNYYNRLIIREKKNRSKL